MRRCQACGFKFVAQRAPLSLAGLIVGAVMIGVCVLVCSGLVSVGSKAPTVQTVTPSPPPTPSLTRAAPHAVQVKVLPPSPVLLAEADRKLRAAEGVVAKQVQRDPAYLALVHERDRLKVALDSARLAGTGQLTLDASAAWNTARLAVDKAWAKAVNADVDVLAARATKAALAEQVAAAAQADRVEAPAITAAAHVDEGNGASDATGYSGTYSGSGSKDVHVNGYTRKDGTYVHSHERSSPGSGSSHGGHK
jgi:hypothetical protein